MIHFRIFQGKGLMNTFWLLGENIESENENTNNNFEVPEENHDEGIDGVDAHIIMPATFTFLVSDHDNESDFIQ